MEIERFCCKRCGSVGGVVWMPSEAETRIGYDGKTYCVPTSEAKVGAYFCMNCHQWTMLVPHFEVPVRGVYAH